MELCGRAGGHPAPADRHLRSPERPLSVFYRPTLRHGVFVGGEGRLTKQERTRRGNKWYPNLIYDIVRAFEPKWRQRLDLGSCGG